VRGGGDPYGAAGFFSISGSRAGQGGGEADFVLQRFGPSFQASLEGARPRCSAPWAGQHEAATIFCRGTGGLIVRLFFTVSGMLFERGEVDLAIGPGGSGPTLGGCGAGGAENFEKPRFFHQAARTRFFLFGDLLDDGPGLWLVGRLGLGASLPSRTLVRGGLLPNFLFFFHILGEERMGKISPGRKAQRRWAGKSFPRCTLGGSSNQARTARPPTRPTPGRTEDRSGRRIAGAGPDAGGQMWQGGPGRPTHPRHPTWAGDLAFRCLRPAPWARFEGGTCAAGPLIRIDGCIPLQGAAVGRRNGGPTVADV